MIVAERLQELRRAQGLSQEQLAEQMDVSRQAVSKWESAQANPDINNIIKLSQLYGVSTDYILTGQEPERQTVYEERIVYREKQGFAKLHDLPASWKIGLAIFLTAFGVFVVVPVLFTIIMGLLSLAI